MRNNRIPWFMLALVLIIIFISGWYIYNFRFEKELDFIKQQSKNEVNFVSMLIKERLQKREYQQAKEYIANWLKNSPDIVYLSLVSSNGYEFSNFQKNIKVVRYLEEDIDITYSYDGSAKLVIQKTIDGFYENQSSYLYQLLLFYAFIGVVFSSLVYSNQQIKNQKHDLTSEISERMSLEKELLDLNATLESRVLERTQELKELNEKIGSIARSAGMAEVASGVLHNIGNVLNSVNVSVTMLREQIRRTKASNLERLVELLNDHQADLPGFFENNEKGRQVPAFLSALSSQLIHENETMLLEIDGLSENIEHIKNVISMQQSYAGSYGVLEKVSMPELIDDALKINKLAKDRETIQIEKKYAELPLVYLDKHKILQIFINLISNARHALIDSGHADKKMSISISVVDNAICIEVTDNGIGIEKDNLSRLFTYGYTNRRDGHGFGLHNSALVANELGGKIEVHSEGAGRGASFVLKLELENLQLDEPQKM